MGDDNLPVWKTYLYTLQQQAPKPRKIVCNRTLPTRPGYYGQEFHGAISREETDCLLSECDGLYLVRESQRALGTYTLAIRFEGITKNFKLFYDGQHYVGEKRFDDIDDLVADGLITFYLESKAADYINALSKESNYAESPYLAYNSVKKKRLNTAAKQRNHVRRSTSTDTATGTRNSMVRDTPDATIKVPTSEDVRQYEKPHLFKVHNFKGPHWCDFCANFMWGLIAQGVKCQDCGFQAHKKCSEKVPPDCLPDMKYVKRCFGIDLTTLVKAQQRHVPIVVEMCVKEIEKRGLDNEGLYRVAGFHDDVEAIKMAFDKDGESTDISAKKYDDINTISSVLKLYFRLLPIPIITFEAYPVFIEAVKTEHISREERCKITKQALTLLPPAHYHTLKFMLSHLIRVTERQLVNKMTIDNLATVFAPTLLRSIDTDPIATLTAVKFEREVVETLLMNMSLLFDR